MSSIAAAGDKPAKAAFWPLTLGAVGVVYGDIGTSPLYAFREAAAAAGAGGVTLVEVVGVVSLLLWALILIVTLKYVVLMLRLDNRGEGGMLSLLALVRGRGGRTVLLLGAAGAALFYGDAVITPAISVLSAVEGLELVAPAFAPYVVPTTLLILFALFLVQRRGTDAIARWFGPVTAVWFLAMALIALPHIVAGPEILAAFDPRRAAGFLAGHGLTGFLVLGAVFLAVTGAEALYADMGHFGRGPIRAAWFGLVFPALGLNYLGQGALVLHDPSALGDPFFHLCPPWALLPVVLLATAATVIASQAVITGAFSLTRQAVQLGLLPRFDIRHTSETHPGQIYLPRVNRLLLIGVVTLVLLFKTSASLAAAYGIAVTGAMLVTTALAYLALRHARGWSLAATLLALCPFAAVEAAFLGANLLKVPEGGYIPLLLAGAIILLMDTWVRGTAFLMWRTRRDSVPLLDLVRRLETSPPPIVVGTAVFLTAEPDTAPPALLHNLKHNHVLHERNVILTVATDDAPRVAPERRITIVPVSGSFVRIEVRYGYAEAPNLPRALALCRRQGFDFDIMATSFFLSRRHLRPSKRVGLPLWRDRLYIALAAGGTDASDFFHLPADRVVELGRQYIV